MSKFTIIRRANSTDLEIYDGGDFISLGLTPIGGNFSIHLDADTARELAAALLAIVERQEAGEPA